MACATCVNSVDVAAKGGVKLWLHGHRHGFYCCREPPFATSFPVICGGSSTQTELVDALRIYRLTAIAIRSPCRRVYNPEKNMFEDADRFALQLDVEPFGSFSVRVDQTLVWYSG